MWLKCIILKNYEIRNMKTNFKMKALGLGALLSTSLLFFTSCEDFLNRPTEDNYNTENYYASDEACISGVNYLYNSPWYDFQRGFIKVGEVMSGNMYWGSSPYLNFSVKGTDEDLVNMSYSLWSVISHCSTVYESLKGANASQAVKNQCMGECLAWKAMAYFYLVRSFGDIPIIHDNSATLAAGDYNELSKVQKADVYDYIIYTLEKARDLLPESSAPGRIDRYCVLGLMSKVYLTKAGVTGALSNEDLYNAETNAKEVIDKSGRNLLPEYADVFRGSNNNSEESLFAWRWTVGAHWTCQNSLQSDLGIEGMCEVGNVWGGWGGPSTDLMEAFGVLKVDYVNDTLKLVEFPNPSTRPDIDTRRKATLMLPGDVYPYFWRDKGGFDYLEFIYNKDYNISATEQLEGPCGTNNVKNLYGNTADHVAEMNIADGRMASGLATHILRLSDVYLVYAEAMTLQGKGDSIAACDAYNKVHQRAIPTAAPVSHLTFDMIWKERRLEFAGEGDRWYDYVRRAYYDVEGCIKELKSQHRNQLWNCDALYKAYWQSGRTVWNLTTADGTVEYNYSVEAPNVTANSFVLPFPKEDVALNPNLEKAPIHVNVREKYPY